MPAVRIVSGGEHSTPENGRLARLTTGFGEASRSPAGLHPNGVECEAELPAGFTARVAMRLSNGIDHVVLDRMTGSCHNQPTPSL